MQQIKLAAAGCLLTLTLWMNSGPIALAAIGQATNDPMTTFIEMRISNQSIPDALKTIAAAANIEIKFIGEETGKISDWTATGELQAILENLSKEHSLCMHYDGVTLNITPANIANLEIVSLNTNRNLAKRQLRFAIPWSSSNALMYDQTGHQAKVCGAPAIVDIAKRILEQPIERKITIIRYAVPGR